MHGRPSTNPGIEFVRRCDPGLEPGEAIHVGRCGRQRSKCSVPVTTTPRWRYCRRRWLRHSCHSCKRHGRFLSMSACARIGSCRGVSRRPTGPLLRMKHRCQLLLGVRVRMRQEYLEYCPATIAWCRRQPTFMGLDDRFANRQSHPHAPGFRCEEWLEDAVGDLRIDAGARIRNRDQHGVVRIDLGSQPQLTGPVGRRAHGFHCVHDQDSEQPAAIEPGRPAPTAPTSWRSSLRARYCSNLPCAW